MNSGVRDVLVDHKSQRVFVRVEAVTMEADGCSRVMIRDARRFLAKRSRLSSTRSYQIRSCKKTQRCSIRAVAERESDSFLVFEKLWVIPLVVSLPSLETDLYVVRQDPLCSLSNSLTRYDVSQAQRYSRPAIRFHND